MRRRPLGAVANYKAALRKIKRDRAKGVIPVPAHLSASAPLPMQGATGEWHVMDPPKIGPPFVRAQIIAGPFDTRGEAEAWIDER